MFEGCWVGVECTWWCHQMETFSVLLAICAGNSSVTGQLPAQRLVTLWCFLWSALDKRPSKQWWGWWFETPSRPLWRHCNEERSFGTRFLGTRLTACVCSWSVFAVRLQCIIFFMYVYLWTLHIYANNVSGDLDKRVWIPESSEIIRKSCQCHSYQISGETIWHKGDSKCPRLTESRRDRAVE